MTIRPFDADLMKLSEGVCCTGRKRQRPLTQNSVVIQTRSLLYIMALGLMMANAAAFAADVKQQYRIPAQSLNNALMKFAADSNLELIFTADKIRGLKTQNLDGAMTPTQALNRLLQGSGMTYRFVDAHTVTLEQQKNPPNSRPLDETVSKPQTNNRNNGKDTLLADVTVAAESIYDVKDPYNTDYVLPNATAGTKTDTPIMETPLNVQVISKQVLKDQQVITLGDALKNVSGVTTQTLSGNSGFGGGTVQSLFLRGFNSETFFRNGFRLQQGTASKGFANVESVEVLKGPAAILYGLVDPGGMVNVITKQPLATPYYGFTQQFGSYNLYRTTIDATGPIANNKDVLYRMNMSYENSGSFRDFVNKDDVFLAPVLKWNISPKTQVTFEMEYNHQHLGKNSGFIPNFPGQPSIPLSRNYGGYAPGEVETIFGGFNWSHQFNDDWLIKHRFSANQSTITEPFDTHPQAAGTKDFIMGLTGDDTNLSLVPDNLVVLRTLNRSITHNNTYSTNLDLVGHFDTAWLKHTLLFGGDYYRVDGLSTGTGTDAPFFSYLSLTNPVFPGTPFGPFSPDSKSITHTDQYGLYIQDQIKLPHNVHVMGGIRYQYIHQTSSFLTDGSVPTTSTVLTKDAVTPRVGILWQPKSWLSLYANYVESFGPNTAGLLVFPNNAPLPPTSATQYEGGIKTEFFEGKLRASLAYYDLTKTNVGVTDNAPTHSCAGGGFQSCSLALGKVRSRGPELDITGEILPGWNIIATWANTDIIVEKTNAQGDALNGLSPGNRLPSVPRNIGSLWSTYNVQGGDMNGLTFGGGVNLRDSSLAASILAQPLSTKVPGYVTFDLMAGYSRSISGAKVSAQLNINNLLDKRYFSSISTINGQQGFFADFGQPRTFMGSVSIQY